MLSRRAALKGGTATLAAMTAGGGAAHAAPDPLLEGVQALVNEIRRELPGTVITIAGIALQEAADRLEALPGISPVYSEKWESLRALNETVWHYDRAIRGPAS